MSPVQGFVRLRKHQFGRQSAFGTKVAAVKAYGFKGVPDNNLNWTDPDVDAGSLVVVEAPHREAPDLTAPLTDPSLAYNTLPIIHCGFFGGAVTPTGGGTAKTWTYAPAAVAPLDDFDNFTYEFGDDVLTDWFQFGDSIITDFEITGPEGGGVLTASMTWRNGSIASSGSTDSPDSPTVPTAGLDVATNETKLYLKDGSIYISDSAYDLDSSQISDALHTFTLRGTQEVDDKRFANGTQTFDVQERGRGAVNIELECSWAKTADTVGIGSESDKWMSDNAVNRYVQMRFLSTAEAQSGIFYEWVFSLPMRYYTRVEGESGGNTLVILTGHAFYDPDEFEGYFSSEVVNTLAAASL
jgi:hypothetical protein